MMMAVAEVSEHDPSRIELRIVQDTSTLDDDRRAAFDRLLHLDGGWWGRGSLIEFARTVSRCTARKLLVGTGLSADVLDWELIADEALVTLFTCGHGITQCPRLWLR